MNKERIRELAAFILDCKLTFEFNGTEVDEHGCGTAGCSAGHAALLWPDVRQPADEYGNYTWAHRLLAEKLGITMVQHDELFWRPMYDDGTECTMEVITKEDAAWTLRRFVDTGETHYDDPIAD